MTGLNDSRDVKTSVDTVVKRQKQACHEYSQLFKNARIHIAAKAPYNPKQKNLNRELEQYANKSGISYIDHGLTDRDTGHIRNGMLNGIHYTRFAIKTVAKHLIRKLHEDRSVTAKKPKRVMSMPQRVVDTRQSNSQSYAQVTCPQNNPAAELMNTMTSFFKKAAQAMPKSSPSHEVST